MLLRRGLKCFYCGKRSRQKQTGSIRQWDCENCEASNYLDEVSPSTSSPCSSLHTDCSSRPATLQSPRRNRHRHLAGYGSSLSYVRLQQRQPP